MRTIVNPTQFPLAGTWPGAVLLCLWLSLTNAPGQRFSLTSVCLPNGVVQAHGGDCSVVGAAGAQVRSVSVSTNLRFAVQHGVVTDSLPFAVPLRSTLSLTPTATGARLRWVPAYTGLRLEFADNLNRPVWEPYPTPGTNYVDLTRKSRQLFFRVVRDPASARTPR